MKINEDFYKVDVRIPSKLFEKLESLSIQQGLKVHHKSGRPLLAPIIIGLLEMGIKQAESEGFKLSDKLSDTDALREEIKNELLSELIPKIKELVREELCDKEPDKESDNGMNTSNLAKRLGFETHSTVSSKATKMSKEEFVAWTKSRDPEKIGWYRGSDKLFYPVVEY
jgi:hypothetical protein